jgi:hypothetical protein
VVPLLGFLTVDVATPEQVIVDQMVNVNAQLERGGAERLAYEMERLVCEVMGGTFDEVVGLAVARMFGRDDA